jgi:hypothetical protein
MMENDRGHSIPDDPHGVVDLLLCLSRVAEYRPFLPLVGFFTAHFGRFLDR